MSFLAGLSIFFPTVGCSKLESSIAKKLSLPLTLAKINDHNTIIDIGNSYLDKNPDENNQEHLIDKLLVSSNGGLISKTTDSLTLENLILKKIETDFKNGETIVINGWVLSKTEARQCALFSLTQAKN
ncbi:hypothetical protein [Tamlana flava]|uniref:hypothetical protein n=1 Tax=Tamlana flava TaxID=3158572 RepID=UPI00351B7462